MSKVRKKRLRNYAAAPWQPSHSQLKCAATEPSGDFINFLIEAKQHPFTVDEHESDQHKTVRHAGNRLVCVQVRAHEARLKGAAAAALGGTAQ